MTLHFPPRSSHEHEIQQLTEMLVSTVEGRTAIYLSAPITSGQRFSDWYAQRGKRLDPSQPLYQDEYSRTVIDPNRRQAQTLARRLRRQFPQTLIDPTAVGDMSGWTQDDYRHLWACVIERYVSTIIFIDGWQYSNGCAYEFLIACKGGIIMLTEDQSPLQPVEGRQLIRTATRELHRQALSVTFLERCVEELATYDHEAIQNLNAE